MIPTTNINMPLSTKTIRPIGERLSIKFAMVRIRGCIKVDMFIKCTGFFEFTKFNRLYEPTILHFILLLFALCMFIKFLSLSSALSLSFPGIVLIFSPEESG